MTELKNDRYLRALLRQPVDVTPVCLPLLPPPGTVARRLIEDTVAMCRAEYE